VQGLSLPFLIRKMGFAALSAGSGEEHLARTRILEAAIDEIRMLRSDDVPGDEEALADLLHHYRQRLEEVRIDGTERPLDGAGSAPYRHLESRLRAVDRSTALRMRDQNQINDEVLRKVERELDLLEARDQFNLT